jgi:DnaJ-class molecular chaperone
MKNYYEILGVAEDIEDNDLKKAYRKLAKEWHPDKFSQASEEEKAQASEKFKTINEAYAVLSDTEQRKQYDFQRNNPQGRFEFDWNNAKGRASADPLFQEMMGSFMDNFIVFGNGGPGGIHINVGGRRPQPKENKNTNFDLAIYPEKSFIEQEAAINIPRRVYCKNCEGNGCGTCGNRGWLETAENKKIKIPKNSVGKRIRLKGLGWQMDANKPSGDLYLRIVLKDSQYFRILNDFNLETAIIADPTVALIGGRGIINTLDGERRYVDINSGLAQGSRIRLGKHGVLFNGEKTELIGLLIYEPASNISDEGRKLLEQYQGELECQSLQKLSSQPPEQDSAKD